VLYAGNNILHPIRYTTAENELQAKFCMPFLLTAIVISRKAGVKEFTQAFVRSPEVRTLMQKIRTEFDPVIEAKGYDKMRSRVEVILQNGSQIVRDADERYRGGPENPLSDEELKEKFSDCAQSIVRDSTRDKVIKIVYELEGVSNMDALIPQLAEKL